MQPMGNGDRVCPQIHFERTSLADNYAVGYVIKNIQCTHGVTYIEKTANVPL